MSEPPPTWFDRILRAIPPMPDRVWLSFMILIIFMFGMIAGHTLCMWTETKEVRRPSLQYQLDALEKRLKAVESR